MLRGLERDPLKRPTTAAEMALDLERASGVAPASVNEVAEWVDISSERPSEKEKPV